MAIDAGPAGFAVGEDLACGGLVEFERFELCEVADAVGVGGGFSAHDADLIEHAAGCGDLLASDLGVERGEDRGDAGFGEILLAFGFEVADVLDACGCVDIAQGDITFDEGQAAADEKAQQQCDRKHDPAEAGDAGQDEPSPQGRLFG